MSGNIIIVNSSTVQFPYLSSLVVPKRRSNGIPLRKGFLLLEQMMDKLEFTTSSPKGIC